MSTRTDDPAPDAHASRAGSRASGGGSRGWSPTSRAGRAALHLGIAVVLVFLLRTFVAQSYFVPSTSMEPTVDPGDRVVVAKVHGALQPGDLVVVDGTDTLAVADRSASVSDGLVGRVLGGVARAAGIDLGEQDFLKRVAAVGGQHLSCTPEDGLVRDGEPVAEPYLPDGVRACDSAFDVEVPPGRVYLLGDNRATSRDSRALLGQPGGGMIPEDDVVGTVQVRYWPPSRLGTP